MKRLTLIFLILTACCGFACDRTPAAAPPAATGSTARAGETPPATNDSAPRVVFLGDSLTAGLGVDPDEAFPALVGKAFAERGVVMHVVNAGVSGDTTAGGLRRLDWVLRQSPRVLVVGLGANDGLRGLSPAATAENLRAIIRRAREAGARVLLLGMRIPPNYGPEYTAAFAKMYPTLAEEFNVPLVPFVLAGVGGDPRFNQPDGIHPTADGHRIIAKNVHPYLEQVLAPDAAPPSR